MARSGTPYDVIAAAIPPRRATKRDVLVVCRALEQAALQDPPQTAVAAVQDMRFASPRARDVWARLAAAGTEVRVFGRDLPAYVAAGVPGIDIDDDDPLVDVWSFICLWADGRGRGMAGADVNHGHVGEDLDRTFDLVETADPELVADALATCRAS